MPADGVAPVRVAAGLLLAAPPAVAVRATAVEAPPVPLVGAVEAAVDGAADAAVDGAAEGGGARGDRRGPAAAGGEDQHCSQDDNQE